MKQERRKASEIVQEAIEEEKKDFSFEDLIEPYREGGTRENPIRRTWGTMIQWLMGKKFDTDVIGAAILLIVCLELKNGRKFEGNGSYGSPGHQLAQYIRGTCVAINQRKQAEKVFAILGQKIFSSAEKIVAAEIRKQLKPWYKRIFG